MCTFLRKKTNIPFRLNSARYAVIILYYTRAKRIYIGRQLQCTATTTQIHYYAYVYRYCMHRMHCPLTPLLSYIYAAILYKGTTQVVPR